jgi:hypothetical protein
MVITEKLIMASSFQPYEAFRQSIGASERLPPTSETSGSSSDCSENFCLMALHNIPRVPEGRHPTKEELDTCKALFRELYIDRNMTLNCVRQYMIEHHEFHAS